tara:strand:+ start:77 stop:304 length:228 start_codon:yes stop_codon:yes gene_type:complete
MAKKIIDNRTAKKAWSFNMKTGELKLEVEVQPDPNDVNNWLIPRGVTTTEPPKDKKNYASIWDIVEGKWKALKVG